MDVMSQAMDWPTLMGRPEEKSRQVLIEKMRPAKPENRDTVPFQGESNVNYEAPRGGN